MSTLVPAPNVVTRRTASGGTVFVFPGQGSQLERVAVELLDSATAFADEMRLCDDAFAEFVDWSLLAALRTGAGSPTLDRAEKVQPVLFAVMVSLAAQWRAFGLRPARLLASGHGNLAIRAITGTMSVTEALAQDRSST